LGIPANCVSGEMLRSDSSMAVCAPNVTFRDLGLYSLNLNASVHRQRNGELLYGSWPVIKIQHNWVSLSAINAPAREHRKDENSTFAQNPLPISFGFQFVVIFVVLDNGPLCKFAAVRGLVPLRSFQEKWRAR
jgi:hypothetical protein